MKPSKRQWQSKARPSGPLGEAITTVTNVERVEVAEAAEAATAGHKKPRMEMPAARLPTALKIHLEERSQVRQALQRAITDLDEGATAEAAAAVVVLAAQTGMLEKMAPKLMLLAKQMETVLRAPVMVVVVAAPQINGVGGTAVVAGSQETRRLSRNRSLKNNECCDYSDSYGLKQEFQIPLFYF
jgi:hypothetical protein